MKTVAIFFGGISPEHDVSCVTALQTIAALDEKKYEIFPVYVTKLGEMHHGDFHDISSLKNFVTKKRNAVMLTKGGIIVGRKRKSVDCAVLCFHGGCGEGGAYASLFEENEIPYTSSKALPSGVSMDKSLQKTLAASFSIPILPFVEVTSKDEIPNFSGNVVVKPNSLGSSIGVSVCKTKEELCAAIKLALSFDEKALVEKKAENFFELNISAFKLNGKILLSDVERPQFSGEFLSFDEKYLCVGKKTDGMKGITRELPAKISETTRRKVEEYASTLYEKLSLFGIVRFDFIVENEKIYFNEVNAIPGSLARYLWQSKGIPFSKLLDFAIEEGVKRFEREKSIIRNIDTLVLK